MIIKSINISNFRNFINIEAAFSDGVNIFYGNNGSGKTNLLEASFVLTLGRSHRGASETVMVARDEEIYRLEGVVDSDSKESEISVAFQRGGRKKVTIDKGLDLTSF